MDAAGRRHREKLQVYTRQQALEALRRIKTRLERDAMLGVRPDAGISTAELFEKFRRYQKPRVAEKTYQRTDEILKTLAARLPAVAKDITKAM